MSNRLISLLIFLFIIFWLWYSYYYFFIENKWNLTLNWNISNYKVELYAEKLWASFTSECKNNKCELIDLAPFNYELTIKKDGYKNYVENIKITSKDTLELEFYLEKQISINKMPQRIVKNETDSEKVSRFRELSFLQKAFKYFEIEDLWIFYFIDNKNNTLSLFYRKWDIDTKIFTFNEIADDKLYLDKIYQTEDEIYVIYSDDIYIFNLNTGKEKKIFFPQDLSYIKKNLNEYSLINDKWTFVYNINSEKVDYFYMFKDFIIYDKENYLWIIYNNEAEKLKNYNLPYIENNNYIIKYNYNTKQVKVLEKTSYNIKKIVNQSDKIYFYDDKDNKYLVNNID